MPTKQDIEAHAKFWTIEEIAEYIQRTVNMRKPLDEEIIQEWNYYMTIIVEREEDVHHNNMQ